MRRAIKFRLWGNDNKEYYSVAHIKERYGFQWELEQFTGQFDKDGREIWEGDVVEVTYYWEENISDYKTKERKESAKAEIVYNEGAFRFMCDKGDAMDHVCIGDIEDIKVIGTIHDEQEVGLCEPQS